MAPTWRKEPPQSGKKSNEKTSEDVCFFFLFFFFKKHTALPGKRTRVARMGILHDTTTLAVQLDVRSILKKKTILDTPHSTLNNHFNHSFQ